MESHAQLALTRRPALKNGNVEKKESSQTSDKREESNGQPETHG